MTNVELEVNKVIEFLLDTGALKFGEFTLKSGRHAPYFVNTGSFDNGSKISTLGSFYAAKIRSLNLGGVDVVFGPAYKGVPLCVATAIAMQREFGAEVGFTFNRKEAKTRGEGGLFVGSPLTQGSRVVLVEDVVTAGTTLREVLPLLRETVQCEVLGVIILVDRCERGTSNNSAVQQVEEELGVNVFPILTIHQIVQYLEGPAARKQNVPSDLPERIRGYLAVHGVQQ